jgi:hypothetical protein
VRIAFDPNIETAWFTSVMGIINRITMLAIVLAGAAVIREREHGTMDHLLVMPLTPFEIATSKIWANGLVIIVAIDLSLYFIVRGLLGIPIAASILLFLFGVAAYLFFATAIGIFLGNVARSMPQLGLLYLLVYLLLGDAFRQQYATREHAAVAGNAGAGIADGTFCIVRAGDPLSRRWVRCSLAAVRDRRTDWRTVPRPRAVAFPQSHGQCGDMNMCDVNVRRAAQNVTTSTALRNF